MGNFKFLLLFLSFISGQNLTFIDGDINKIITPELVNIRNCPDYVDSCIYVCSDAINNPCHPEDLYSIAVDTSEGGESTEGSRYRIYFPWEYNDANADKFTVTASWPCLSPTYVAASGNFLIGTGAFTLEFWLYLDDVSSNDYHTIFDINNYNIYFYIINYHIIFI